MGSSILHHLPDYDGVIKKLAGLLNSEGVIYFVREPVYRHDCKKSSLWQNLFNRFYESVNAFFLLPVIKRILWPTKEKQEDAREIAVHMFKEGVSIKSFSELCRNDFKRVIYRKYNRRASSFFSYVENSWLKFTRKDLFGNTLFAIGIQKIK
jgi:hypothetical protein